MRRERPLKSIISALLLFSTAACNLGATPTPAPGDPVFTPEPTQNNTGGDLCFNPLYPVTQGATWTYSSTGISGATESYTFTDTVSAVRIDGFTLTSQFSGLTRTQEWSCRPEGLVALQLGSGPAGGISTSQVRMDVTTSNINGVTIPAEITPGQTWSYSLDYTGSVEMAGAAGEAQGNAASSMNALGMESVTVPAGTFDAMKIVASTTMDIQATYQGITAPLTLTTTSTVWFAPNVGWVKMENNGNLQGSQFTETISLESYNIPQ
jgi:hypothetical protein